MAAEQESGFKPEKEDSIAISPVEGRSPTHLSLDSGDEADEKPVREQLEQTTIDKPQNGDRAVTMAAGNLETQDNGDARSNELELASALSGRPARKRSLENLNTDTASEDSDNPATPSHGDHLRKRPRDLKQADPQGSPLKNDTKAISVDTQMGGHIQAVSDAGTPPDVADAAEPLQSPRRKRSRDDLDAEIQREQKIAATDETMARRSSEEQRPVLTEITGEASEDKGQRSDAGQPQSAEPVATESADASKSPFSPNPSSASGFANNAAISPFAALTGGKSASSPPEPASQTSASAFTASGFASKAGSGSTFGTFGASSGNTSKDNGGAAVKSPFAALASTASQPTPSFAKLGASSFASAGTQSNSSAFGGKTFGSSFASGGGFGGKLSSFAAPIGDAKLKNGTKTKDKPFGAPESDEEAGTEDGTESGNEEDTKDNEEPEETDGATSKAHVDTGEEHEQNIWVNRGKLFQFHIDKGTWTERGVGPIRLNVAKDCFDDEGLPTGEHGPIKARLLMRTIATHKVVLNAPVFKEWVVGGDAKGLEPTGKALMFSASVEEKMVPHLLRVGKEDDIRVLWRVIKDLQTRM